MNVLHSNKMWRVVEHGVVTIDIRYYNSDEFKREEYASLSKAQPRIDALAPGFAWADAE